MCITTVTDADQNLNGTTIYHNTLCLFYLEISEYIDILYNSKIKKIGFGHTDETCYKTYMSHDIEIDLIFVKCNSSDIHMRYLAIGRRYSLPMFSVICMRR